jgi:uncharacterized membrane protein YuzA (DUF378 family)
MSQDLLTKEQMTTLFKVSVVIAAIGAVNWYTSIMGTNVVGSVLGVEQHKVPMTKTEKFVYLIVGIAGVIVLYGVYNGDILIR